MLKRKIVFGLIILMTILMVVGCSGENDNNVGDYEINTETKGEGIIELDPDKSYYDEKEEVEITAVADSYWEFIGWSGSLDGDTNPYKNFIVEEDSNIIAEFESEFSNLNIITEGEGKIELNPDKDEYEDGEEIEIKAIADKDWEFKGWNGDLSGYENPNKITLEDNLTISGEFVEKKSDGYKIETEVIEGEGNIELEPNKEEYEEGEEVLVKAVPDDDVGFDWWGGDLSGFQNPKKITVTEDFLIEAEFKDLSLKASGIITESKKDSSATGEWELRRIDKGGPNPQIKVIEDIDGEEIESYFVVSAGGMSIGGDVFEFYLGMKEINSYSNIYGYGYGDDEEFKMLVSEEDLGIDNLDELKEAIENEEGDNIIYGETEIFKQY